MMRAADTSTCGKMILPVKYRPVLVFLTVCLLVLGIYGNSYAQDLQVQKEVKAIIYAMPRSGLDFPAKLHTSNEAYVIITAGAAYTNIYIASFAHLNIADALQNSGLPLNHIRQYSFPDYWLIGISLSSPKPGAYYSENKVQVGRLIKCLRSDGIHPYALLRVPNYASVSPLDLPTVKRLRFNWYDATHASNDLVAIVHAQVPRSIPVFLFYLNYILPGVALTGFIVGLIVGMTKRFSIRTRIDVFDIGLLLPFVIGMMLGTGMVFCNKSMFAYLIQDISKGSPNCEMVSGWVIASCILCIFVPLFGLLIRGRIFRGLDEEPDVLNMNQLKKRAKRCAAILGSVAIAITAYLIAAWPFEPFRPLLLLSSRSGFIPGLIGPVVIWLVSRGMMSPSVIDNELTLHAQELALRMGITLRRVMVAKSSYAKRNINGFAHLSKRTVIVTQKAVEALSPAQFDWLLAHELAHFKQMPYRRRTIHLLVAAGLAFVMILAVMLVCSYIRSIELLWVMTVLPAFIFIAFNETSIIMRQFEYEADKVALLTICDLDVSISTLMALATHSENPKLHDQELDEHPKISKRIKALKTAAREAGIADNETTSII